MTTEGPARPKSPNQDGFTMTELMITVAIIGVLAMIALPKFGTLTLKSNERATQGKLGSIRSALTIYYTGNGGAFPGDLTPFTQRGSPYFMSDSFTAYTLPHGHQSSVIYVTTIDPLADTGQWAYVYDGPDKGELWLQCTHSDSTGRMWSSF